MDFCSNRGAKRSHSKLWTVTRQKILHTIIEKDGYVEKSQGGTPKISQCLGRISVCSCAGCAGRPEDWWKVQQNIDSKVFTNACPIRMSYVLNSTGHLIKTNQHPTVSGADGKRYLFRVSDMMAYLEESFGNPDKTAKSPSPAAFANLQGILVVRGHGWRDAKGHVTLWDGSGCSDTCHLLNDPENGTFVPDTASIWVLP